MKGRYRNLFTAGVTLVILVFGAFKLGIFSTNRLVVTTLTATGPDFDVVLGRLKLKMQVPDSVRTDVSGVMLSKDSMKRMSHILHGRDQESGGFFILTENLVGVSQNDSESFHPVIKVQSWHHVTIYMFCFLIALGLTTLMIFMRSMYNFIKLSRIKTTSGKTITLRPEPGTLQRPAVNF